MMKHLAKLDLPEGPTNDVSGEFVDLKGERYYRIGNVDSMPPFLVSLVSASDHWLFISSTGGLTAGRVSPDLAMFPYVTDDKIHDAVNHTGSRTVLRVDRPGGEGYWEPFNVEQRGLYATRRNLYKSSLGDKLCFEEINQDLELVFRYTWMTSEEYGFVRSCELQNLGRNKSRIEVVDGLLNILPAGVPRQLQQASSNLVDAYKWSELDEATRLATYSLYSGITDKPEPQESLRANTVFCQGLDGCRVLLSQDQLESFLHGGRPEQIRVARGVRGAYLVNVVIDLAPGETARWQLIGEVNLSQAQVVRLRRQLESSALSEQDVAKSVARGSEHLRRIIGGVDGFQDVAEEQVAVHHYANTLFNSMRGGVFDDQYRVARDDFVKTVRHFNSDVYRRNRDFLEQIPQRLLHADLLSKMAEQGDRRLVSLCQEYLPITFGRRHGDPSRPWNEFEIRLKDEQGNPLLYYQGNWRDIFQNWEALVLSYPEFAENVIAKFVNASTIDGYNPYRITKDGIDWEVEDPDDPWSHIGYWGDHQIIYLLKLLEMSSRFHPGRLKRLLRHSVFCYANVPYRIVPFDDLLENPKDTVRYDHELAAKIEQRVSSVGADGKLLFDSWGDVYHVNLLEKLLVPLLSKLGNLVAEGGIWLNTQRPEWNDANNALVGHGLSMVTLYYMRRYVRFLQELLLDESGEVSMTREVAEWLGESADILQEIHRQVCEGRVRPGQRLLLLGQLGRAASRYRKKVYRRDSFGEKAPVGINDIIAFLDDALVVIDHSIRANRRDDGLYHAYNLLKLGRGEADVSHLYPMLEGQVAVLSSGAITPVEALNVLDALFASDMYRADQKSFMLYPDRELPGFLEKNRISGDSLESIPWLLRMVDGGDGSIVVRDEDGCYRFNADIHNSAELKARLDTLEALYGDEVAAARGQIQSLYEAVFDHHAFTGRSGGMFGYEGLGCIYWHMVSKLLLAVQEVFFAALDQGAGEDVCARLGEYYYRVREGIGFNKPPADYGAFPTDPYSHTPKHAGARQPGMTGQVKEEIITRFGELGVRVDQGRVRFQPALLRRREFAGTARVFSYLDVGGNWCDISLPEGSLAFTWCQVPVIYRLNKAGSLGLTVSWSDGRQEHLACFELSNEVSREIFARSGKVRRITLDLNTSYCIG